MFIKDYIEDIIKKIYSCLAVLRYNSKISIEKEKIKVEIESDFNQ